MQRCVISTESNFEIHPSQSAAKCHYDGDTGICGVAVSLIFWDGIAMSNIPILGVAVVYNRTLCGVSEFKPTIHGDTPPFIVTFRTEPFFPIPVWQAALAESIVSLVYFPC